MSDFPYTPNPATLRRFFEGIQSAGVPDNVTLVYIKSLGFKSSNDRYILPTLKALEFVDSSGKPKDNWVRYRHKGSASSVMASAVRATYADLFSTYADADRKDNEALRNFFSTHTRAGEAVLGLIVRTFKTLCELADFNAVPAPSQEQEAPSGQNKVSGVTLTKPPNQSGLTLNINIQLQLQATDDASVYEKFFAAMKKHLFPAE